MATFCDAILGINVDKSITKTLDKQHSVYHDLNQKACEWLPQTINNDHEIMGVHSLLHGSKKGRAYWESVLDTEDSATLELTTYILGPEDMRKHMHRLSFSHSALL
jgi:hypothetical protein